jgi:hypothetical protein
MSLDGVSVRLEWQMKQQFINKKRANHLGEISSAAVFSVSSNRLFKRVRGPQVSLMPPSSFEDAMRRLRTAGILVLLIVVSALAGYEVGVHQPVWSSSTTLRPWKQRTRTT